MKDLQVLRMTKLRKLLRLQIVSIFVSIHLMLQDHLLYLVQSELIFPYLYLS